MKETIFKQIINYITECQDTEIKDVHGQIKETGMAINETICVTTDLNNQGIFIHNGCGDTFAIHEEDEYMLFALKELFSDMERDAEYSYKSKKTTQEVEVQEQSNNVIPLSNSDFVTEIATNIAKEVTKSLANYDTH